MSTAKKMGGRKRSKKKGGRGQQSIKVGLSERWKSHCRTAEFAKLTEVDAWAFES